jgi:dTDP-4-dehydrorhamnose reductase
VYSPFGKNFLKTMMALAQGREELKVVGDQRGNPTSALDIADGLLVVLGRWAAGARTGIGETHHLAGSGAASWAEFAAAIFTECARLGRPHASVTPIRTEDWPTKAARPAFSMLDCSSFETTFGYRMPDWRKSTGEVVARLAEPAATAP